MQLQLVLLIVLSTINMEAFSQNEPIEMLLPIQIGETEINMVKSYADTTSNMLFINLHENENTSIQAMKSFAKSNAINYLYLQHKGTRRINFSLDGLDYNFDPNRIFTSKGRTNTLLDGGFYSARADSALTIFANQLMKMLDQTTLIIALHNNTDSNYSILSYSPEGDESQNTEDLYINPKMDEDDFIYTTDKRKFDILAKHEINVILQDNENFVDDGSLSVYCGMKKIHYVNIECEEEHLEKQIELIEFIMSESFQ